MRRTVGGFVGFTSFLTTFFHEQYHLSDRLGGYRLLTLLLAGVATCIGVVTLLPPPRFVVPMLFLTVGRLGMGNGAAGGLGGFFLPSLLGVLKDATGTYASGLLIVAVAFTAGTVILRELGVRWRRNGLARSWRGQAFSTIAVR